MPLDEAKDTTPARGEDAQAAAAAETPGRLGRVVSVAGSQVVVLIEDLEGAAGAGASARPPLQLGAIARIPTDRSVVFGMVSGQSIPMPARGRGEAEFKLMQLELLGESDLDAGGNPGEYRRGVSSHPVLGSPMLAASAADLRLIYVRPSLRTAKIGRVHQDHTLPALIGINDLLGKHFAVVGGTGSGKSCAVTLILRAILDELDHSHVLLLDAHNEYSRAFADRAEVIGLGDLQLPYWLLNLEEICEVVANVSTEFDTAEAAILSEFVGTAKQQHYGGGAQVAHITADTPTPYRMTAVVQFIDQVMGRLEKPDSLGPYQRLKAALEKLMSDARFAFMFGGGIAMRDNMTAILSRFFRIPVAGKPLTILDLSAMPTEILNVVISVLCRMTFDLAMWAEGAVPILLVCEEAHRYAPEEGRAGFEPTKRALSRIAKEGRKHGLSLCVVSQRPSELAVGMLSQCGTIFAMRLTQQKDQNLVRAAVSDSAFGLLDALPSLGNAEAIAVGDGVPMPMRLKFATLPQDRRPRSSTADFSAAWKSDVAGGADFLATVVDRWRRQGR